MADADAFFASLIDAGFSPAEAAAEWKKAQHEDDLASQARERPLELMGSDPRKAGTLMRPADRPDTGSPDARRYVPTPLTAARAAMSHPDVGPPRGPGPTVRIESPSGKPAAERLRAEYGEEPPGMLAAAARSGLSGLTVGGFEAGLGAAEGLASEGGTAADRVLNAIEYEKLKTQAGREEHPAMSFGGEMAGMAVGPAAGIERFVGRKIAGEAVPGVLGAARRVAGSAVTGGTLTAAQSVADKAGDVDFRTALLEAPGRFLPGAAAGAAGHVAVGALMGPLNAARRSILNPRGETGAINATLREAGAEPTFPIQNPRLRSPLAPPESPRTFQNPIVKRSNEPAIGGALESVEPDLPYGRGAVMKTATEAGAAIDKHIADRYGAALGKFKANLDDVKAAVGNPEYDPSPLIQTIDDVVQQRTMNAKPYEDSEVKVLEKLRSLLHRDIPIQGGPPMQIPTARLDKLLEYKKHVYDLADFGMPATPENRPYRLIADKVKEFTHTLPGGVGQALAHGDKEFSAEIQSIKRARGITEGSDIPVGKGTVAADQRARSVLGRAGDDSMAGLRADPELAELAAQDPMYERKITQLKALRAREGLRFSLRPHNLGVSLPRAVARGAVLQNLDPMALRVTEPIIRKLQQGQPLVAPTVLNAARRTHEGRSR